MKKSGTLITSFNVMYKDFTSQAIKLITIIYICDYVQSIILLLITIVVMFRTLLLN